MTKTIHLLATASLLYLLSTTKDAATRKAIKAELKARKAA
jgi:hypothetical protein